MNNVFRCQPVGLELNSHQSETSNGELDRGVHVFNSLEELYHGVYGWCRADFVPEIVEIAIEDPKYLQENGDCEGLVLVGNRGKIVGRTAFGSWDELAELARERV